MSERIRVELKFKNAVLYNALVEQYPPINPHQRGDFRRAAMEANISYAGLLGYLSLGRSPWNQNGDPTRSAERVSFLLGISCEELFPRRLYAAVFPRNLVREIDGGRYLSLLEARQQKLLPQTTEDIESSDVAVEELKGPLEEVLHTLSPRKERIIRQLFGIDTGEGEKTLAEVSAIEGVSVERIRQIKISALRNLRHPVRTSRLRPFLDQL